MTRYSFNNYEDLKQAVVKHMLTSDKHIILEGKGDNGKSMMLRELRTFILDHNFDIRHHPENTYEDLSLDESESDEEDDVSDDQPGEEKELKIFCRDKIAYFKQPKKFIIINELDTITEIPKGPTKKILYRKLKEYYKNFC